MDCASLEARLAARRERVRGFQPGMMIAAAAEMPDISDLTGPSNIFFNDIPEGREGGGAYEA